MSNVIEKFIDKLIDMKSLSDADTLNSVKFTITLDSLQNKRLEKVCEALGQKRASFSADSIMQVVSVAEEKLGFYENKKYIFDLVDELREEEKEKKIDS